MEKVPPGAALWDCFGDPIIREPVPPEGRPLTETEWLLFARADRRRTARRRWHARQARRNPKPLYSPPQRDTAAELQAAAERAASAHLVRCLQGEAVPADMLPGPPMRAGRAYQAMLAAIEALPAIRPRTGLVPPPKPWTRERI